MSHHTSSGYWSDAPCSSRVATASSVAVVVAKLNELGADVRAPRSVEFDLTVPGAAERMLAQHQPSHVIHLAARVGGIGYNQAEPAPLYLDNLLMGTHVIEAARQAGVDKTVLLGTVCSYPKHTPVPFQRGLVLGRLPRGDQRAVRHRQEGPSGPRPGERRAVRPAVRLPDPHQPVRPGRQVPPGVSHVIPALMRGGRRAKCVEATEPGSTRRGRRRGELTGTASREYLRETVRRRRRRRPSCQPRGGVGLEGHHGLRRGHATHRRVVPGPSPRPAPHGVVEHASWRGAAPGGGGFEVVAVAIGRTIARVAAGRRRRSRGRTRTSSPRPGS
jgi:hypothetical protein